MKILGKLKKMDPIYYLWIGGIIGLISIVIMILIFDCS